MTEINKSRIKKMRNSPTEDICDFSSKLKLSYSQTFDSKEFKEWQDTAVAKLAKQGKPFELTGIVKGVSITVRGKRI